MSSSKLNPYKPDLVTPPGEVLLEKLEELGMTQLQAGNPCSWLSIHRSTIRTSIPESADLVYS